MQKQKLYRNLPDTPGVYIMKDREKKILYIGKAANLKRRVSSYFTRPHDARIERMVQKIDSVGYRRTDSALEALILEAQLIKKHEPPFNIREKDGKSFLYIEITKEKFPRVRLVRGTAPEEGKRYGPFVSAGQAREAFRILRKIFPWNMHPEKEVGSQSRPCFDAQIGLCPGTCVGGVDRKEYAKTIRNLKFFLSGKKKTVLKNLEKDMVEAGKKLEFEKAEHIKRRLFALNHIQDIAFIRKPEEISGKKRIEGYDVSNMSGRDAVGVMVVFEGGAPFKSGYRKFGIKSVSGADDVAMMHEVLIRRFRHPEWKFPDLVLVDGGVAQVNTAKKIIRESGLEIPVVGIAKGPRRDKNEIVGKIPPGVEKETLVRVRDEAHRFAISFHRKRRSGTFIPKGI